MGESLADPNLLTPIEMRTQAYTNLPMSATLLGMRTIGIRELRERSATFIKRAGAGEQMIITVSGDPVATLGPITSATTQAISLIDLVTNGSVVASRRRDKYQLPVAVTIHSGSRIDQTLREVRG
ncbi:MAG: type II toxin-antitoxin system prevent-host-death family antitoxin [Actinobacteria bacterium]|nr:MAG: type II toxin-antitoxin system prevent-host-death family antitoxin [Actinomycetota bacterium]